MTASGLTVEDEASLEDCTNESYIGALPYAGLLGLGTLAAVKGGLLKRHSTRGAIPKVAVATLVGYILGKLSYTDACISRTLKEVTVTTRSTISAEAIGTQTKPQNTAEWSEVSEFASVYNNQGRRQYNEDRAVIHKIKGWTKFGDIHVFSVLDGHGGQMAVELAKKNLFSALEINVRKLKLIISTIPRLEKLELYRKHFGEVPGAVIQYLDATADVTLCFNNSSSSILGRYYKARGSIVDYISVENDILYPQLLTDQVLKCDKDILAVTEAHGDRSGSTLLLALMDGAKLWVANVGDSRGVMLDGKGETIPLSFDHKPNDPEEKKRIEDAGGFVMFWGVWRVNGILALSRALGDIYLKKDDVVTAQPDVLAFELNETKPAYAVLATDGLWDTHSNEEAVNFLKEKVGNADLDGAEELAKDAIKRGSGDNVTVMVINLKKYLI